MPPAPVVADSVLCLRGSLIPKEMQRRTPHANADMCAQTNAQESDSAGENGFRLQVHDKGPELNLDAFKLAYKIMDNMPYMAGFFAKATFSGALHHARID